MEWRVFLPYLFVMAGVTYLIRMLPLTLVRKPVKSRFVRSFLSYVPYAVLGAMTVPDIFTATGNLYTAVFGLCAALVMAWREKSLITVALAACGAVFIAQFFFH